MRVAPVAWVLWAAWSAAACSSEERLFVEVPWSEGERVVLAVLRDDGSRAPEINPRLSSPVDHDVISVERDAEMNERLRIVALRYPEVVTAGVEACGVTFEGEYRELGPAEAQWEAVLDENGLLGSFEGVETPEDVGLTFSACTPPISSCDELSLSIVSVSALEEVNLDHGKLVDDDDFVVLGNTEDGTPLAARVSDSGAVLVRVDLQARATSLVYAGSSVIVGLVDGTVHWLDPHSLETQRTAQVFSSMARVEQRDDGLNIAYSESADEVFELSATSTETIERMDFPVRMRTLQMQVIRDMSAAFLDRPPVIFDPPNNRWVEIVADFTTMAPELAFNAAGLYLISETNLGFLSRQSFTDAKPKFTSLELPGGPVHLQSATEFWDGVLVGGSENSLFFFDVDGNGCALSRDEAIDSTVTELIALNDGRAIGFTTNVAGIGSLSPRIIIVGSR